MPPEEEYWSPYSSTDANAGNTLMISVEDLVVMDLISAADLPSPQPVTDADFPAVVKWKTPLLRKAAKNLLTGASFSALRVELAQFQKEQGWVVDSALFDVLSRSEDLAGLMWWDWPAGLRCALLTFCVTLSLIGLTCTIIPRHKHASSSRHISH